MLIYLTVGTQLPFDRLVWAMDNWAAAGKARTIAQIGKTEFRPVHLEWHPFLSSSEADDLIRTADLVVSHAGMGTILTRLEAGRPLIVMPRRSDLGEHRNNHQVATVGKLSHLPGITVVHGETELVEQLDRFQPSEAGPGIGSAASPMLISTVREFISHVRA